MKLIFILFMLFTPVAYADVSKYELKGVKIGDVFEGINLNNLSCQYGAGGKNGIEEPSCFSLEEVTLAGTKVHIYLSLSRA